MNKRIKRKKAKEYFFKHESKFERIWNERENWDCVGSTLSKEEHIFMEEVEENMFKAMKIIFESKR